MNGFNFVEGNAFSGCLYFIISPAARSRSHTAGGIPIGTGNDLNYLGSALAQRIAPQILHQPQLAQAQSPADWQIRTATLLAQSPSLSLISAWSPTLLLNIVHTLHQQQDTILRHIPDAHRRRTLAQALAPAIPRTQQIWTQLDTISCWDSHTAAAPADQLRQLFPHAHLQGKGLLATEGITTLPFSGCLLPQQRHQILFTRCRQFCQRYAAQLGNRLGDAPHVGGRVLLFRLPKGAVGFQQ